jgi:excisionase family DNA binding protein
MTADEPRWASVTTAAEYLDASVDTVRRLINEGRIQRYRTGNRLVRVDLNEIDRAMGKTA